MNDQSQPSNFRCSRILLFLGVGALLYVIAFLVAERLVYVTGHSNPIFKIDTASEQDFDWVILGASHAMPLDFDDFNQRMQQETGLRIINLAGPGTGPLYNKFVLEHFLRRHGTKNVLYATDSFAFNSPQWNEERLADPKLLARTPYSVPLAINLGRYVLQERADPRAMLDYATGFSKINNSDRLKPDIWEGEAQFDRVFKPSTVADRKRIDYLYPSISDDTVAVARYLADFAALRKIVRDHGARMAIIKMPLPAPFYELLPRETDFDQAMDDLSKAESQIFRDFSQSMIDPRFYSDTDHLNRSGVSTFFFDYLKALLMSPTN
jgi:hypothetical protein